MTFPFLSSQTPTVINITVPVSGSTLNNQGLLYNTQPYAGWSGVNMPDYSYSSPSLDSTSNMLNSLLPSIATLLNNNGIGNYSNTSSGTTNPFSSINLGNYNYPTTTTPSGTLNSVLTGLTNAINALTGSFANNGNNSSGNSLFNTLGNPFSNLNTTSNGNSSLTLDQLKQYINQLFQNLTQTLNGQNPYNISNTTSPNWLNQNGFPFTGSSTTGIGNFGGQFNPPIRNTTDLLSRTGAFPTLFQLLQNSGLTSSISNLEQQHPLLVFAPTEAAFQKLQQQNPALYQRLMKPENANILKQILQFHVCLPDHAITFPVSNLGIYTQDSNASFNYSGNAYQGSIQNGNQSSSTGRALQLGNGTIIVPVDDVLIPPGLDLSTLA